MDDPQKASSGSSNHLFQSLRRRRRRSPGTAYGLIAGLVLLVLAAAGAWYWFGRDAGSTEEPVDAADVSQPTPATDLPPRVNMPDAPPLELPELDASDALVREMVGGLSSHPRLARWLVPDDLVRRFVASVVNISAGGSPAGHLGFLAPDGPFRVERSGDRTLVDPASYGRYSPLVDAFVSLDTEDAARLYRQLHPLFEEAYAALGVPDRSFDETFAVALGNLLAVEVPEGPIAVQPDEAVYAYRDPALEALSPAEKHLLRLGPENARRVQAKLSELAEALGIEPRPAGSDGAGEGRRPGGS